MRCTPRHGRDSAAPHHQPSSFRDSSSLTHVAPARQARRTAFVRPQPVPDRSDQDHRKVDRPPALAQSCAKPFRCRSSATVGIEDAEDDARANHPNPVAGNVRAGGAERGEAPEATPVSQSKTPSIRKTSRRPTARSNPRIGRSPGSARYLARALSSRSGRPMNQTG